MRYMDEITKKLYFLREKSLPGGRLVCINVSSKKNLPVVLPAGRILDYQGNANLVPHTIAIHTNSIFLLRVNTELSIF